MHVKRVMLLVLSHAQNDLDSLQKIYGVIEAIHYFQISSN